MCSVATVSKWHTQRQDLGRGATRRCRTTRSGCSHMSSAKTTDLKPLTLFEPPLKLRYEYFTDEKGRPRSVAEVIQERLWLSGYVTLPDKNGQQRLVAHYVKIKGMLESTPVPTLLRPGTTRQATELLKRL